MREARENMDIIDTISRTVFGKTEYYETLLNVEENIEFRTVRDIKNIIKTLS